MTQTPVTFVKELTEYPFLNTPGSEHRLYAAEDGTLVVTSYAATDEDFVEHTLAWVAADESGYPDIEWLSNVALVNDDFPHVDGPVNHEAALEQVGYTLASEDANA